jgi:hypothetical protein
MIYSQTQKPPLGSLINLAHPLAKTAGWWLGNEGSGNRLNDLSGNGNNGTLVNHTSWAPGRSGSALSFDGTDDYVNIAADPLYKVGAIKLSIGFWARPITIAAGTYTLIMGNSIAPENNKGVLVFLDDRGTVNGFVGLSKALCIGLGTPGANVQYLFALNNAFDTTSGWHYYLFIYDGKSASVLKDGISQTVLVSTTATNKITGDYVPRNGVFSIGAVGDYQTHPWNGLLDDVRIFPRGLSAQEVWQLYASPFAMFDREPYWMWGQGGMLRLVAPTLGGDCNRMAA